MAFNIKKKIAEIKALKRSLPVKVGNIAKNHYLKAFRDEGFTDARLDPWQKRKTRNRSDRRTSRRRAILVDTGALRRSIRVGSARRDRIEVGSYGIPYASFHNQEGGKMPQRRFVGPSKVMNRQIRLKIRNEIKDILK